MFRIENGIVMQHIEIESKKANSKPVSILQCSDIHLNILNQADESNAEVMYTKAFRLR